MDVHDVTMEQGVCIFWRNSPCSLQCLCWLVNRSLPWRNAIFTIPSTKKSGMYNFSEGWQVQFFWGLACTVWWSYTLHKVWRRSPHTRNKHNMWLIVIGKSCLSATEQIHYMPVMLQTPWTCVSYCESSSCSIAYKQFTQNYWDLTVYWTLEGLYTEVSMNLGGIMDLQSMTVYYTATAYPFYNILQQVGA